MIRTRSCKTTSLPDWLDLYAPPSLVWTGEAWQLIDTINLDTGVILLTNGDMVDIGEYRLDVRPCALLRPVQKRGGAA